jgi:hypothetical protein
VEGQCVGLGVTGLAPLALGMHCRRLQARHAKGHLREWEYRFAWGAVTIAMAATLFSALPSVAFLL